MTNEQDTAVPRALPADSVEVLGTARAKKTTTKYIGTRWYRLTQGEKFQAPYGVIKILRDAGFAE